MGKRKKKVALQSICSTLPQAPLILLIQNGDSFSNGVVAAAAAVSNGINGNGNGNINGNSNGNSNGKHDYLVDYDNLVKPTSNGDRSPPTVAAVKPPKRQRRRPGWFQNSIVEFDSICLSCPICHKSYETERKVAAHVRNVHRKPFKCDLCRRQYFTQEKLSEHRKTHNTDSHFECRICHLKYKREETLQSHFVRVHSDCEAIFGCDYCGKRYKLKQDLLLHINQVHMCTPQICRFCGKEVKNVKAHEWHHQNKMKADSNAEIYKCRMCYKRFRSESKLENHLMRHVQCYTCNICGLKFTGPGQLINHRATHKPATKCKFCDKNFTSQSNYYQHVLMHAKVRPYKCDMCREDFTQRSTLVRHWKTSHPGRPTDNLPQVPIAELARQVLKSFEKPVQI
ncbi:hypothetical protein TKK_0011474 [Trichogramma kaykai]